MNIFLWLKKVNLYKLSNKNIYNDAFFFLKFVLNKDISWIIVNNNYILNFFELNYLNFLLIKRLHGEPLYYLINKCYFYSLSFKIYPDIFIPRKDTEIMVDYAIKLIKKNKYNKVLDLGSGLGSIAISIAKNCPLVKIIGLDINKLAINLAKYNSLKLKINNVFFYESNWFSLFKKDQILFDLIISNPPYLSKLDEEYYINNSDLRFESYFSLISLINGIKDISYIIYNSYFYLCYGGTLIIEHSYNHKTIIQYLFNKRGYKNIYTYKDYNNKYRFTIGNK